MKNNQVLKIGQFGDHDLARLALRELLNSMLQFGKLSLKEGEARPRYDVKSELSKGIITRSDGTVLFEAGLASLVKNGKQVRLALIAYRRLLRERGILQFVRDNSDLEVVVNTRGNEVVLFGFDSRSKSRVQRFRLVRDIEFGDIDVTLTALPNKLSDAVKLGAQIEDNFLKQLEAAKQSGDTNKVVQLENLGAELGILKKSLVSQPKPQVKTEPVKTKAKPNKKSRWNLKGKNRVKAQAPVAPVAIAPKSVPASEATPAETQS